MQNHRSHDFDSQYHGPADSDGGNDGTKNRAVDDFCLDGGSEDHYSRVYDCTYEVVSDYGD